MALISLRQLLDHAAEHSYGVPAFNVNNLEQMRAIMEAADQTNSPVIVQASAGARKYAGANFLRHLILAALEEFPHIPVCMHQDHGTSPAICQRSIQMGFSSVMMDGSLLANGNAFFGRLNTLRHPTVENIIPFPTKKQNKSQPNPTLNCQHFWGKTMRWETRLERKEQTTKNRQPQHSNG